MFGNIIRKIQKTISLTCIHEHVSTTIMRFLKVTIFHHIDKDVCTGYTP